MAFKDIDIDNHIILPQDNFLEVQWILKEEVPFIEIYIVERVDKELSDKLRKLRRNDFLFTSKDHPDMFENQNKLWIFKWDTSKDEVTIADYRASVHSLDEEDRRELQKTFYITTTHSY